MNAENFGTAARTRLPRIALMGEFSAGKSTLANFLMGRQVSPVKVTATQLPPVWYSRGPESAMLIGHDGRSTPIEFDELGSVRPADARALRVYTDAEVLEFCDLIDMPGTSDPNMGPEVWESMMEEADAVIWCTASTQAWRQTEAAIWEQMDPTLWHKSLLLITRMDKLLSDRDRNRVIARVRREAGAYFRALFPISLTEALSSRGELARLKSSGAEAFVDALMQLVDELGRQTRDYVGMDHGDQTDVEDDPYDADGALWPDDPEDDEGEDFLSFAGEGQRDDAEDFLPLNDEDESVDEEDHFEIPASLFAEAEEPEPEPEPEAEEVEDTSEEETEAAPAPPPTVTPRRISRSPRLRARAAR